MRHTFESLGYQSGFYLSQLFSSTRNASSSSTAPLKQPAMPIRPPPPLFNWGSRPLPTTPSMLASPPNFQNSAARMGMQPSKDEPHMFLLPHSNEPRMEEMIGDHENDIKWPNGLSFFSALTARTDEAKLLFNSDGLGGKPGPTSDPSNPNDFLSLDTHSKMDAKFKRSFTLPARMVTSSSSSSLNHLSHNPGEYRNDAGMYSDAMETFLE